MPLSRASGESGFVPAVVPPVQVVPDDVSLRDWAEQLSLVWRGGSLEGTGGGIRRPFP